MTLAKIIKTTDGDTEQRIGLCTLFGILIDTVKDQVFKEFSQVFLPGFIDLFFNVTEKPEDISSISI
jgi:hypothetical protein